MAVTLSPWEKQTTSDCSKRATDYYSGKQGNKSLLDCCIGLSACECFNEACMAKPECALLNPKDCEVHDDECDFLRHGKSQCEDGLTARVNPILKSPWLWLALAGVVAVLVLIVLVGVKAYRKFGPEHSQQKEKGTKGKGKPKLHKKKAQSKSKDRKKKDNKKVPPESTSQLTTVKSSFGGTTT